MLWAHLFQLVEVELLVLVVVEAERGLTRLEAGEGLVRAVFRERSHRLDLVLEQVGQVRVLGQEALQDVHAESDVARFVALNQPDAPG